jgi:hypothetical protein
VIFPSFPFPKGEKSEGILQPILKSSPPFEKGRGEGFLARLFKVLQGYKRRRNRRGENNHGSFNNHPSNPRRKV